MWEIIDAKGTLFSGSEDEMRTQFEKIKDGSCVLEDASGDIKLIQVHEVWR